MVVMSTEKPKGHSHMIQQCNYINKNNQNKVKTLSISKSTTVSKLNGFLVTTVTEMVTL